MQEKMKILVGYDGSPQSKKAVDEAIKLAKCFSGFIKVISVYPRNMQQKTEVGAIEIKETLNKHKVDYDVDLIQGSNPSKILEETAQKEKFNLIIIGSRGLGSTASLLLGSVSRQVVTNANCNVLVVKD